MTDSAASVARERIVVGVDDAPASRAGLLWAAAEAVLRRARLEVVHSWQPVIPLEPAGMVSPPVNADLEAGARAATDEVLTLADGFAEFVADAWPTTEIVEDSGFLFDGCTEGRIENGALGMG